MGVQATGGGDGGGMAPGALELPPSREAQHAATPPDQRTGESSSHAATSEQESGNGSGDDAPAQRYGTTGFQQASLLSKMTYRFVSPLVSLGARGKIDEDTAAAYLPESDTAAALSKQFDAAYATVQAEAARRGARASPAGLLWRSYWRLYRCRVAGHLAWTFAEIGVRVGSPIILRQLLNFFSGWKESNGDAELYPQWRGWMWAGIMGAFGYCYAFIHHQLFWYGMRMGFDMRQQAIAAVQAKVLRLNAVAVADQTAGKIVNLVSNDVRRFDDAMPFYNFLICAPVELAIVFVLVGLKLGFLASLAGVSTLIMLIPVQGGLVRYIGRLRAATAAQTDERVRLQGEVFSGVLATKMLGWEGPFLEQIREIRRQEASHIRRMARIRAFNMGLSFTITPLSALAAFGVARATATDQLTVANVFYSLALLALPKLYFCDFFTLGVQFMSELRITMRRLGAFLCLPEPPAPWHAQQTAGACAGEGSAASGAVPNGSGAAANGSGGGMGHANGASGAEADVAVAVAGADFDWADRSWAAPAGAAAAAAAAAATTEPARDGGDPAGGAATAADGAAASPFQLRQLEFSVRRGQLVAIVGSVGAGKSSILAALLGELQPSAARAGARAAGPRPSSVTVRGSVAYCSQVAWIASGSFKENILFGRPYNKARYAAVLEACALEDDVAMLPAGSDTELGERGINLSGGQKARLALARAAYSGADVQLLDDPLSAVDPRVGRVLFDRCISNTGLLAGATRLLVTHQRQFLSGCDSVIVLRDGSVAHRGTYAELAAAGVPEVMASQESSLDDSTYDAHKSGAAAGADGGAAAAEPAQQAQQAQQQQAAAPREGTPHEGSTSTSPPASPRSRQQRQQHQQHGRGETGFDRLVSRVFSNESSEGSRSSRRGESGKAGGQAARWQGKLSGSYVRRALSARFGGRMEGSAEGKDAEAAAVAPPPGKSGRLNVAEDRAVGSVSWSVYGRFAARMGLVGVSLIGAGLLVGQAILLYGDYWLGTWASKPPAQQQELFWVWGYACMVGALLLISFSRSLLFYMMALRASTRMHEDMAARVLRAPLAFFHTNPTGRILNRFSKDQGSVDEQLPQVFFEAVQALMMVLGAFILLMVVVPFIIPVFLPLAVGFFWVRSRYLATSREVKRFESTTRSPVFASFSAILKGLPTIRAYGAGPRFRSAFLSDLSDNGAWWFCFITTARWIGFRLDILVALLMTAAPLLMMAVHESLSARLAGLALTQSLQLAGMLQWMVRQSAEVENNMTSVERMLHYTELEQEPPTVEQGGTRPPEGWPNAGKVEYRGVTAIYRPGLPPVLRDLTFTLEGGVSCGVVGRTGSGKSSLMLTLFRLIPLTAGSILIDGVDTAGIALDALRRQVAIIPQDPVLFSGTLRSNLDPWGTFEDARLWEAVKAAQLGGAVAALGGLDARMQEAGDNFSVGQRQLFCLARALLQEAAVLALDECTANVDGATDELIQRAVRECTRFGDRRRTLMVIAHRIDTILDCDQLLVLQAGQLVEQGPPGALAQSGGLFSKLVSAARSNAARGAASR